MASRSLIVEGEYPAVESELAVLPGSGESLAFPPVHYDPEIVETMAWPDGMNESALVPDAGPKGPLQVRCAATGAARELARYYRLCYDKVLFTDAYAIESMQRHLLMRFGDAVSRVDPLGLWELRRHGALLSEIFARSAGAEWVDVSSREPSDWLMFVPRSGLTQPIEHIYRLVARGHREPDLLAYYQAVIGGRVKRDEGSAAGAITQRFQARLHASLHGTSAPEGEPGRAMLQR